MDPVTMAVVGGGMALGGAVNSGIKGKQQQRAAQPYNDAMAGQAEWESGQQRQLANQFGGPTANRWRNQNNMAANTASRQLNSVNARDNRYFRAPNRDFTTARNTLASAKAPPRMSLMKIGAKTVNLDTSLNLGRVSLNKNLSFAKFNAPKLNKYNFDPTQKTLKNTMRETLALNQRARDTAVEKYGDHNAGANAALTAQLTARGLGGGGIAAAALSDLHRGQAQQQVELERGMADQAGQALLQAGQFDATNQLQLTGMESQYNLGFNQLNQERSLNQFNTNAQWKAEANRQNNDAKSTQFSLNSNAAATEFSLQNEARATQFSLNEQSRFNAFNSNLSARDQFFSQGMERANFNLNKAGAYMNLGTAADNRQMMANQIGRQMATDGYNLKNTHYQQNFLQPQLAMQGSYNPGATWSQLAGGHNQAAAGAGQAAGAGIGQAASMFSMPGMYPQGGPGGGGQRSQAYGKNPGDRRAYR